jgi:PIN domain nuclease of toxin-antitoxin system
MNLLRCLMMRIARGFKPERPSSEVGAAIEANREAAARVVSAVVDYELSSARNAERLTHGEAMRAVLTQAAGRLERTPYVHRP